MRARSVGSITVPISRFRTHRFRNTATFLLCSPRPVKSSNRDVSLDAAFALLANIFSARLMQTPCCSSGTNLGSGFAPFGRKHFVLLPLTVPKVPCAQQRWEPQQMTRQIQTGKHTDPEYAIALRCRLSHITLCTTENTDPERENKISAASKGQSG